MVFPFDHQPVLSNVLCYNLEESEKIALSASLPPFAVIKERILSRKIGCLHAEFLWQMMPLTYTLLPKSLQLF